MDLEANFMQMPPMHQSESGSNNLYRNGTDKLNPGLELDEVKKLNLTGDNNFIENDVNECPVSKKIHKFYFVKFRSYEDPELKAKIKKAENLIWKKYEDQSQIRENMEKRKSEQASLKCQLKCLTWKEKYYSTSVAWKRNDLESLHQALGKLFPPKNTSLERAIGLCSSVEELNDLIRSLHYGMLHRSNSLAEEKKHLREIKQVQGIREKFDTYASTIKKSDFSSLDEAIQYHVMRRDFNVDGLMKDLLAVRSKINRLKTKMVPIEKDISSLQKELTKIYRTKEEAHARIFEQRKQHDKTNACYYKYLSVLNDARELAEKKDIAALEELSHREVEKFMSKWSNSKAFRDDYEKRILPSIDSQQLSRDGRTRNSNDKLPVFEASTHVKPETEAKAYIKGQKKDCRAP